MPAADPTPKWEYRAHLDGIRAVAVYLVVAFHAGLVRFGNGFIGVDVFFVLSGYLVTALLLRDLSGPSQRIGFGRFYSRRVRRLLPAAALNLVVTAIVFAAIAAPIEFDQAASGIRAASLYVANWHFIAQSSDYFAPDVANDPVLQYWSLAVEEQFYLFWPVLLTGLVALAGRAGVHRTRALQALVALGALCSAGWALHLAGTNLERAYYGTDTRVYQLFGGALLALSPGIIGRVRASRVSSLLPVTSAAAIVGLVALATTVVNTGPIGRGVLVTVLTLALLISLEASSGGVARALLSWGPLAYLGKISYGTYLWHWLVIVVLTREAELSHPATAAVTAVVATGIASLSYQVLEQPIRLAPALDRYRPAVIASGLVMSLVVGLVIAPRILSNPSSGTSGLLTASADSNGTAPDRDAIQAAFDDTNETRGCEVSGPTACLISEGSAGNTIVVGESHAGMIEPLLAEVTGRHDLALYAGYLSFCPWTQDLRYGGVGGECFDDQADLYDRIIAELDPEIVFLAHRTVDDPQSSLALLDRDAGALTPGTAEHAQAVDQRTRALVARLRTEGRTVVMFEPVPVIAVEDDTLTCLSRADTVDECRFVASAGPLGQEMAMRDLAANDEQVVSVDLDPLVCPYLPICDPIVNGMIVKKDDNHLTLTFAESLADPLDEYLANQGVWD